MHLTDSDAPGPRSSELSHPEPPRRWAYLALVGGLALAAVLFVALGSWQLQRLQWKEALIARIGDRVGAPPQPAPGPTAWPRVEREDHEYLRVEVRGRFDHERETLVQASTDLGTGWWVLTPLRTEEGWWLLVNRGFVDPEHRAPDTRATTDGVTDGITEGEPERGAGGGTATAAGTTATAGPPAETDASRVIGLLRLDEPGGSLLQDNVPGDGRWYSRDLQAIAAARDLDDRPVAPYFIDAQASTLAADRTRTEAGTEAWPRPGLTVLRFSNNHLQYALTWFAMAAGAAGMTVFVLRDERRRRTGSRRAAR